MLTLFTVPKPFRGHIGDIQRNAIESWRALRPEVQIVLVGDEEGVEEASRETGVEHVGHLARNERGTPRLDSAFQRVETVARHRLWCLANADVVLLDDFLPAVNRVASAFDRFLMVGECRDLHLVADARLGDPAVRAQLRRRALTDARLRGYAALDYFVFPQGEFGYLPPFLIGRACFDNWLVWRARDAGHPVIDATRSIVAVHQSHDYLHVPGGLEEAYYGEEARHNERLAGGRSRIYTLHDASHRLRGTGGPYPYWGSAFRLRERARAARAQAEVRLKAKRARHADHPPRPFRLLGIFPEPGPETTPLLDAAARAETADLTVLYAREPTAEGPGAERPRYAHWFPRSFRLLGATRILGREYPVNWAIWLSFRGLMPDCMLIAGWHTFAAQAALLWCGTRSVPYLLLVGDQDVRDRTGRGGAVRRAAVFAAARKAAGVVVTGPHAREAVLASGVPREAIRELTGSAEETASHLLELCRSAVDERWADQKRKRSRSTLRLFGNRTR